MRGVIRPKGGDKFEVVVDIGRDPLTGKRRRSSRTVAGKRKAEAELSSMLAEARGGKNPATTAKLGDLLDEWLEQAELSPTTRQEYARLIERRIKPALGHVGVRKLTAYDLDRFYKALAKGEA